MALFSIRGTKGGSHRLSSEAVIKGYNGEAIHDLDAFYGTDGKGRHIENADVVSSVIEIVTKVARMKLDLKRDDKRIKNDKLVHLINEKPNKWESAYNFKFNILSESIMRGNAFIEIVRDEDEEVKELRHLRNDRVVVYGMYTETGEEEFLEDVEYYIATCKDGKITENTSDEDVDRNLSKGWGRFIKSEDMVHLKPFNFGGLVGLSILDYLREDIDLSNHSRKFLNNFIKTGGSMGGNIKVDTSGNYLPSEERELIRKEFLKSNSHYTSVYVTDDKVQYIPKETSSKMVSSLLENKTTATRFAQMFGLPLHKMGVSTSNMSLAQLNQDFRNNTLVIYLQMMESEFNDKFYRVRGDYSSELVFDTSTLSSLDEEAKQGIADLGTKTGALTINEVRILLGFDKKDDPLLDKHRVSLNYVDIGKVLDYQLGNGKGEGSEVVEDEVADEERDWGGD